MTINNIAIDTTGMKFRFVSSTSHHEYRNEARVEDQTRDPDTGFPLWKVRVSIVDPKAETATTGTVTVPSAEQPVAEFDSEIDFENLTVRFWVMNQNLGQSFTASKVITPPKPSPATGAGRKQAA